MAFVNHFHMHRLKLGIQFGEDTTFDRTILDSTIFSKAHKFTIKSHQQRINRMRWIGDSYLAPPVYAKKLAAF
jgi:hypothetical protein